MHDNGFAHRDLKPDVNLATRIIEIKQYKLTL